MDESKNSQLLSTLIHVGVLSGVLPVLPITCINISGCRLLAVYCFNYWRQLVAACLEMNNCLHCRSIPPSVVNNNWQARLILRDTDRGRRLIDIPYSRWTCFLCRLLRSQVSDCMWHKNTVNLWLMSTHVLTAAVCLWRRRNEWTSHQHDEFRSASIPV